MHSLNDSSDKNVALLRSCGFKLATVTINIVLLRSERPELIVISSGFNGRLPPRLLQSLLVSATFFQAAALDAPSANSLPNSRATPLRPTAGIVPTRLPARDMRSLIPKL